MSSDKDRQIIASLVELEQETDWGAVWKSVQEKARVRLLKQRVRLGVLKAGERKSKSLEVTSAFGRGWAFYIVAAVMILVYFALSGHWLSGGESGGTLSGIFGGGSDVPSSFHADPPVSDPLPTIQPVIVVTTTGAPVELVPTTRPGAVKLPTRVTP